MRLPNKWLKVQFSFFFLLLLSCLPLIAQELRFGHLDRLDGLVNDGVSSIVQDEQGFLWFGTKGGLTRYDGNSFVIYKNDPFDKSSLSHNLVQTLFLDTQNILWIGTYRGLNRFDIRTRKFTRYIHDPLDPTSLSNDVVTAIHTDRSGRLWVGTLDGLNSLEADGKSFAHHDELLKSDEYPSRNTVRSIYRTSDGTLWFGTYGGLLRYDDIGKAIFAYVHEEKDDSSLPSSTVMALAEDTEGYLWVACWGGGLARLDRLSSTFTSWHFPDQRLYTLETKFPGRVFAGSWGAGLYELDYINDGIRTHREDKRDPYGLSHDVIYSLFKDNTGLLWIGTNGGGLNKLDQNRDRFILYKHRAEQEGSLAPGNITAILEDMQGALWVGTYNGGLSRLDPGASHFHHFKQDFKNPASLSNDIVNGLIEDESGDIWVATNEGLNRINRKTYAITRIMNAENGGPLAELTVYSIAKDRQGRHWYGYFRKGLELFDPKTQVRKRFSNEADNPKSLSNNLIYFIYIDSLDRVWIGTNTGLNLFNPDDESFTRFVHDDEDPSSIPSNTLRNMLEDSRGRLWVATVSGGLSLFDPQKGKFFTLSKKDGLPDDTINSILEDERGRLWLGTPNGLCVFDPESRKVQRLDMLDGLQGWEFSFAAFKNTRGQLFFGGANGVNRIESATLYRNMHRPPVCLTSFKVFDKEMDFGIDPSLVKEIKLAHEQNYISFEFSALDYAEPSSNQYLYKLDGFDKDWIEAGSRRIASYTNLDGGRYTFRVKASNNHELWNEEGLNIQVLVSPPFWKTPAAYILYAVAIFSLLSIVSAWARRGQRLRLNEAEIAERRRIEAELKSAKEAAEHANNAKSEFLAHLSHEIRTPMNAVLGYTAILADSLAGDPRFEMANLVERNGRGLLSLLNDALDLARIEAGKANTVLVTLRLRQLSSDIIELFRLRAQEKALFLDLTIKDRVPKALITDETKLRQIMVNLIGNAVKFTKDGGVSVVFDWNENVLSFFIRDTGPGIPEASLPHIFDAFYQEPESGLLYGGTGLGLSIVKRLVDEMGGTIEVLSEMGKGTAFTIHIPQVPEARVSQTIDPKHASEGLHAESQLGHSQPLNKESLRLELSLGGAAHLSFRIREDLQPLCPALGGALIVDEWEAFFICATNIATEADSLLLKAWIQKAEKALSDLDIQNLESHVRELLALI